MKVRICIILFLLMLFSCRGKQEFSSFAGTAQGTTYSMVFENNNRKHDPFRIKAGVDKILRDFDMSFSLYVDSSLISRINRNEDIAADEWLSELLLRSKELSLLTRGAFDITVGPLVRTWGFGPDGHRDISPEVIDSLLQVVGMDKAELRDGKIHKSDPRVSLDFNAIAQGYSVDVIAGYFDELDVHNYLVEIGGEVRAKGRKGQSLWRIGIDRPVDDNFSPGSDLTAVIEMTDRSLATSGNYRKFYVEDGIKYSHTINPATGYPARNQLLSATVLASDCATADGIATACMVMGKDRAIEFLDLHPEFDAYLVYSDESGNYRTWMTEKLKENISEQ